MKKIREIMLMLLFIAGLWLAFALGGYISFFLIVGWFIGLSDPCIRWLSILWLFAVIYLLFYKKTQSKPIRYILLAVFVSLLILPQLIWTGFGCG